MKSDKTPPSQPSRRKRSTDASLKSAPEAAAEKRAPAPPRARARKPTITIPPLLLEGDEPSTPRASGPGQRYAVSPNPPNPDAGGPAAARELPESYGTGRLLLTARDPHWLYAHWDFSTEELRNYNALSADHHLVIRVHVDAFHPTPFSEVHVHPESRNWFVHVGRGSTRYVAELGYYSKRTRRWVRLAASSPTLTPSDELSPDTSVQFATIPVDVPFQQLVSLVKSAARDHVPLAEALLQLRAGGHQDLPKIQELRSARWTREQEQALATLVSMDQVRRVWIGSLEITELIRRKLVEDISSRAAAQLAQAISSVSSPYGGMERARGFWFNVNAELVIYGSTEPDAEVTIGGRRIKLRPDGTFSYRFSLPDGTYDLPAVATSADGDDSRSAGLKFSRRTDYSGSVGAHPQDPALRTPHPAHVT